MTLIPSAGDEGEVFGQLLGEPEDQLFIFNVGEDAEDKDANVQSQIDDLKRENAALKAAQTVKNGVPSFEETYRPPQSHAHIPQAQPQQQFDSVALNKQIETDIFGGNALGVFQKFNAAAVELAEQRAMQKLVPLQASIVKQNVSFFKQTAGMEPAVAKEFDKMVKQYTDDDLSKVDVAMLPDMLTNMKRLAFAKAYEEGFIPAEQRRAPMYGGAAGGGASVQKGQKQVKLTAKQQDLAKIAREDYGWDDKMIYEALQNGELDG